MISVRFYETPLDGGTILHDTLMAAVPRAGETVTIRWPGRHDSRFKVTAVDYLIDVRNDGATIAEDLTAVRIEVREIV